MDVALQVYYQHIADQPLCEDSWFQEALARYRAGDEEARSHILGSCLRVALAVVERQGVSDGFWDHIQEANAALTFALKDFRGATASEFLAHADRVVAEHLQHS